tara:strand:+ start:12437 stop:14506 length:2070 start_codon:yes stop_codon:yes gene_type:complete
MVLELNITENPVSQFKVALNMIVKNESKVITRLLDSVLHIVDTYCICDTGSTDDTKEIIKDFFDERGIEGIIFSEEFINFEHNRNISLQKCQKMVECDYILLLDADMVLEMGYTFNKDDLLKGDYFYISQGSDDFVYRNVRIVKNIDGFKYIGVTHEYISVPWGSEKHSFNKEQLFIRDLGDGGCKDNKFQRDIDLLQARVEESPNDHRSFFYLANSFYDVGNWKDAIENYKKRIKLGGWKEEIFYCWYRIGLAYKQLNLNEMAIYYLSEAYNCNPGRAESLYEIIKHYRITGKHSLANLYYQKAIKIGHPSSDALFVKSDIYNYRLDYEFFIFYYYLNTLDKEEYLSSKIHKIFVKLMNNQYCINNILCNYKFYKINLRNTINNVSSNDASKILVLSGMHNIENKNFNSSTPSITRINPTSGRFLINIRYVNYYIEGDAYKYREDMEATQNVCLLFDNFDSLMKLTPRETFNINRANKLQDVSRNYLEGTQDVRLMSSGNKVYFIGAAKYDEHYEKRSYQIEFGQYDYSGKTMKNRLMMSPNNRFCEKNWTLFHRNNKVYTVYEWNPLTIYNIFEDKLVSIKQGSVPPFFNRFSGSSNGITIDKELWFVCHFISHEDRRYYYHTLVVLDIESLNVKRYSIPFTFNGSNVEYCCGLESEGDYLLMTYSVNDSDAKLIVMKKDHFNFIQN